MPAFERFGDCPCTPAIVFSVKRAIDPEVVAHPCARTCLNASALAGLRLRGNISTETGTCYCTVPANDVDKTPAFWPKRDFARFIELRSSLKVSRCCAMLSRSCPHGAGYAARVRRFDRSSTASI